MCEWGDTVHKFVLVPAEDHHSQDGEPHWEYKPIDSCIAEIVDALNKAGIYTSGSCCAHGKGVGFISLHDGRQLFVATGVDAGVYSDMIRNLDVGAAVP